MVFRIGLHYAITLELKQNEASPGDYPLIRQALDSVFTEPWTSVKNWGQPLVTFPKKEGAWLLPNGVWHCDHPYVRPGEIKGVNLFCSLTMSNLGVEVQSSFSHRRCWPNGCS